MGWGVQCLTSSGTCPEGIWGKGEFYRELEEATRTQGGAGEEVGMSLGHSRSPSLG